MNSINLLAQTTAPGGVTTGLQHWLKVDNTAAASLSQWNDASGNNRHMAVATGSTAPTVTKNALNFNAVVNFDAVTGAFTKTAAQGLQTFTSANTAAEVFGVVKGADNASRGYPWDYGTASRGNHWLWSNNAIYEGFASTMRLGYDPVTKAIIEAKTGATVTGSFNPFDWAIYNVRSAANNWGINVNSSTVAASATNTINFTYAASAGIEIGSHGGLKWKGTMPEVALYNRVLTATERQQVETYFSLKFGMPITHNFVSPSGATLLDYTVNGGTNVGNFNNNITSIARSDVQGLHQRQGAAWKNTEVITIGNYNIIDRTNGNTATSGNDIAVNESYLIISDDNRAAVFDPAPASLGQYAKNRRNWKVQETGTIGSVRISFNTAKTTGATSYLSNAATADIKLSLIVSNDATWDNTDRIIPMTYDATTKTWNVDVDLTNGQYFTVLKDLDGPGCISAGPVLWFKADMPGTTSPTTIWEDMSGNNADVTSSTTFVAPSANTTRFLNFNPTYSFNGTSQYFSNSNFVFANGSQEHFAVSIPSDLGAARDILGLANGTTSPTVELRFNAGKPEFGSITSAWQVASLATDLSTIPTLIHGGKTTSLASNNGFIQYNGTQGLVTSTIGTAGATNYLNVGARRGTTNDFFFKGDIAEIVSYDQSLTTTDRQRVASYLAVKYGITLNHNYLNGKGATIWDYTANASFNNNIFGVGREDCQGLHQRQSATVNAGKVITLGNNNLIATSNSATSGNDIATDAAYLLLGDNNGDLYFGSSPVGNAYYPLGRKWKVSNTGIGSTKLSIPAFGNASANAMPDVTSDLFNDNVLYLLVDADGDGNFSNATATAMTLVGTGTSATWEVNATLPNNAVVTFGAKKNVLDSDNDGVVDIDDLDDDNDGVLDTVEQLVNTPLTTVSSINTTTKVITGKVLAIPDSYNTQ